MYDPMTYVGPLIIAAACVWLVSRYWFIFRSRSMLPNLSDEQYVQAIDDSELAPTALQVREVLRKSLGSVTDKIHPDRDLFAARALGNNFNLNYTGFIMDLERAFNTSIPTEVANENHTIRWLSMYLYKQKLVQSEGGVN